MYGEIEQGIIFTVLSSIRIGGHQVKKDNATFKTGNVSLHNTHLRSGSACYRMS